MIVALVLISQGTIQNLNPYRTVSLLEPVTYEQPKTDPAGNPVKDAAGNQVSEKVTPKEQTLARMT